MVTKWKKAIKTAIIFTKENKMFIFGAAAELIGFAVLFLMNGERYSLSTMMTLKVGAAANLFLGTGLFFILGFVLKTIYKDWLPADDKFYGEWKAKWRKQQLILGAIGLVAFALAFGFFINQRYSYYNYSIGYFLMGTVLIQYGIGQVCLIRFMWERMNMLMDCMTKINKKSLAAAIEIERQSIEKAAKSERLKVDLISNVSHDLKTPLTSMVGYLELMKREDLSDTSRDYVEVMSDKAEKLKEMIESLFSLAKASSGNIQLNLEPIEMNRLMEQLFADMDDRISQSGLQFVTRFTEEDTHLISDNLHMYRICQNLIENAIKYSAKGTRVFVKTFIEESLAGEKICLEITNTAGYLMDFDKEDIVERFARGDKSRTDGGNGLGLAIVSTYSGALGGSFDITIDCDQFKTLLTFPKEN